ncbi:MAG: efflux RND transporter periplasmic adaptor subunit, partial [Saprospiraceae bacterium]|nr:efflux RND transporter periplasmic adaptor subunit [Saprospiraceae bacterium]
MRVPVVLSIHLTVVPMSPKAIRVVALVIAALLLGAFLLYQFGFLAKESPESIAAAPPPNPGGATNAIPVKAQLIRSLELTDFITVSGSTLPAEEVMVSSEVPGKVKEILFREGDVVKKGASLIHLDDDELMAQRNRLEVQARLNEKIAERLKALYEKEGVSLQELEIAEAEYQKALSELTLLDAQLEKRVIRAPFSGRLGLRLISEG